MTEFLYEDRKTYFSGTKGPSAKNEVFIGGGVHWSLGSDQSEIRRRLLNSSNAQSFRHLDNLEQFIKVVIDDFGYFAVEYHE